MANTLKSTIRYKLIDEILQGGRKLTLKQLFNKLNNRLIENDFSPIQLRQFHIDINSMKQPYPYGFDAPIVIYKEGRESIYFYESSDYSILNQKISKQQEEDVETALQLIRQNIDMLKMIEFDQLLEKMEQSFKLGYFQNDIVHYQQNKYTKGTQDHFQKLRTSIKEKQVVNIIYKPYFDTKEFFIVHPYLLKQYNQRWYLIGYVEKVNKIYNLALDRILNIKNNFKIKYNSLSIDFNEYFEDCIGVTKPENASCEEIFVWISRKRYPYIESKPIHESQIHIKNIDERAKWAKFDFENGELVKFNMIINQELITEFFSFGADLVVLEPLSLRETIYQKYIDMGKKFFFEQ